MPALRISWPSYLVTVATGLPLLGAWSARRLTWRDPVGQVGLVWGAQFLLSVAQMAFALTGHIPYVKWGSAAAALLAPLLLVPLLTWMGPRATRWRTPLLALFAVAGIVAMFALGPGRQLTLLYLTSTQLVLAILALGMLVAQAGRAGDPQGVPPEPGWVWIGGGHLVYFLATVVSRPLIEFLIPLLGREPARDVSMGLLLVYSVALAGISWGQWKGRRDAASPSASRAAA
ncbi:hypothetical protein [Roseisolibacter agri]|uniref:Uncharacterized protein n=1 Tax=Roseisolibacter agri TaxID=2014610 RepID=A0AA37Q5U4_9BACT|nr:hypothetical protein [Roseisolibacter agri]GLC23506.1 hypothetical protein rosag_00190 [Roseisolibacter agri]